MASETVVDSQLYIRHSLGNAHELNINFENNSTPRAHLAAQLLLYDTITIPTVDFGIIPTLISWIGLPRFQDSLTMGVFRFLRPPGLLGYGGNGAAINTFTIVPEKGQPWRHWWQEALFGSKPTSVDLQLRERCSFLSRADRENIVSSALASSTDLKYSNDFFLNHVAEEAYRDILASPVLSSLVASQTPLYSDLRMLPGIGVNQWRVWGGGPLTVRDPIGLVLRCAEFNLELLMSSQCGDADIDTIDVADHILRAKLDRCGAASEVQASFCRLLSLARVPDIGESVRRSEVSLSQIFDLRNGKNGIAFRKWLRDASAADGGDLSKAYIDMLGALPHIDRVPCKLLRIGLTTAAGLLGVVPGAVIGAADSFFVSRWLGGYNPKLFLDQVSDLVHRNQ